MWKFDGANDSANNVLASVTASWLWQQTDTCQTDDSDKGVVYRE
jgi:hypothetical protein